MIMIRFHYLPLRIMKVGSILMFLVISACIPKITVPPTKTFTPKPPLVLVMSPTATVTNIPLPIPTASPTKTFAVLRLSPDGTKRLQSMDWKHYEILNAEGKVLWSFSYDVNKFGAAESGFLYEAGYVPFYWSPNGKELYLSSLHGMENSSIKFYGSVFINGNGLSKFDIETGEMTEIIPELRHGYYAFAISPDGNQLVYANQTETPVKIKLLDLNTFKERVLFVAEQTILEVGSFGWSPKMDRLIFMTLEIPGDPKVYENRTYNIFTIDIGSSRTQEITENIKFWLRFKSWNEQGVVFYEDDYQSVWQLSLSSQELSKITTATPWPSVSPTSNP